MVPHRAPRGATILGSQIGLLNSWFVLCSRACVRARECDFRYARVPGSSCDTMQTLFNQTKVDTASCGSSDRRKFRSVRLRQTD